jgi:hypothetical protein
LLRAHSFNVFGVSFRKLTCVARILLTHSCYLFILRRNNKQLKRFTMILNRVIGISLFFIVVGVTRSQANVDQNEQLVGDDPAPNPIVSSMDSRQLQACTSGSIVNGAVIKLGVMCYGNLNFPGGIPSYISRETRVGLRYIFTDGKESESTSQGTPSNDWGASAKIVGSSSSFFGYASASNGFSTLGLVSFQSNATHATSVVIARGPLKVTHRYRPSPYTRNLYEGLVTYENTGTAALTDLRYRRIVDWDIEPTIDVSCVTIDVKSSPTLENVNNFGLGIPNPLDSLAGRGVGFSCIGPSCLLTNNGPDRIGADFQFLFKECDNVTRKILSPRGIHQFKIYLGAAENKTAALAILKTLPASEAVEVSLLF